MGIAFFKRLRKKQNIKEGTIWRAPNMIWSTNFAKNKKANDLHPALIERLGNDTITAYLTPGSTKDYKKGSCVFKTRLNGSLRTSHFLLKLSMPYLITQMMDLEQGWSGVNELNSKQIDDLIWQVKICKGIDVKRTKVEKKWWQRII